MDLFKGYFNLTYVNNRVMVRFLRMEGSVINETQFVIIFLAILFSCGPGQPKFDPSTWNEMDDFFMQTEKAWLGI